MTRPFMEIRLDRRSRDLVEKLSKGDFDKRTLALAIVRRVLNPQGKRIAGDIAKEALSGQILRRRTGQLAAAIEGRGELLPDRGGIPAVRVGVFRGPALQYAAAQELGADIEPVKAKALAVPNEDNRRVTTRAGVEKFGGPRNYPGELRFIPFRNSGIAVGALYDAKYLEKMRRKRGGTLRDIAAAYILLRRAEIPAKHYLREGMIRNLPSIAGEIGRFLADVMTGKIKIGARA